MRLGKLLSVGEIVESAVTEKPPAPVEPKPGRQSRQERPVPVPAR